MVDSHKYNIMVIRTFQHALAGVCAMHKRNCDLGYRLKSYVQPNSIRDSVAKREVYCGHRERYRAMHEVGRTRTHTGAWHAHTTRSKSICHIVVGGCHNNVTLIGIPTWLSANIDYRYDLISSLVIRP